MTLVGSPFAHGTLIEALASEERDVADFFGSLSPEEVALRIGDTWTPAEHLHHLSTAVSAVARGFSISRWMLRLRFGRARRPSRSFTELRDDYRARLGGGAGARGPFVPPREELTPDETTSRRAELVARWQRVNSRLVTALGCWSDRDLEGIQLPHPILGKITAREMVFFTIYHGYHHIEAAKRRLPRFLRAGPGVRGAHPQR
ncbi:MAG: DinB family protein [Gemmatimonadaceae bacterium]